MNKDGVNLWIRSGRSAKGLSQRALADSVGVGVPYISKIEAGKEQPSEDLARRIAEALDLDADELLLSLGRVPERFMRALENHPTEGAIALTEFAIRYEWSTPTGEKLT